MIDSIATCFQPRSDLGLGLQLGSACTPNISALFEEHTMKLGTRISLLAVLFLLPQFMIAGGTHTAKHRALATTALARLPMSFEPAQTSGRFVASSGNYRVSIGANDSYVAINNGVAGPKSILHFAFDNANPTVGLQGSEPLPGVINYYRGQ